MKRNNLYFNKKVRKTWSISPVEKVKKSKKKYNRKKFKKELRKIYEEYTG